MNRLWRNAYTFCALVVVTRIFMKRLFLLVSILVTCLQVSAQINLTVQADSERRPFLDEKNGVGTNLGLWTYETYHRNGINSKFENIASEAGMKLIRFPAGEEADQCWFDRSNSTDWYKGKGSYTRTLRADFLTSAHNFAEKLGGELLIIVNSQIRNAAMAADIVKFCNVDNKWGVRYFEIGNEPLLHNHESDPVRYAQTYKEYATAMKAVDPDIIITGPCVYQPAKMKDFLKPFMHEVRNTVEAITVHWYPMYVGENDPNNSMYPSVESLMKFEYPESSSDWTHNGSLNCARMMFEGWSYGLNHLRDQYSPGAPLGITEMGGTAGGGSNIDLKYAHAVWWADALGRVSYFGADFVTQFLLQSDHTYTLVSESGFDIRPAWYTFVMYNRYFGDMMYETASSNEQDLAIWASTKNSEDNKLYLMVINKNGSSDEQATINLEGAVAKSAVVRVMNAPSLNSESGTNIDGVTANSECALPDIPGKSKAVSGSSFTHSFDAHSVTSIVLTTEGTITSKKENRYYENMHHNQQLNQLPAHKMYDASGRALNVNTLNKHNSVKRSGVFFTRDRKTKEIKQRFNAFATD